jgi:hypothetical protein
LKICIFGHSQRTVYQKPLQYGEERNHTKPPLGSSPDLIRL